MGAPMIKPRENEYPGAFHIHGVLYYLWSDCTYITTTDEMATNAATEGTVEAHLKQDQFRVRIGAYFKSLDEDKDGIVSREDYLSIVQRINKIKEESPDAIARPDAIPKAKEAILAYADAVGLTEGVKASLDDYLKMAANVFAQELAKWNSGETTLLENMDQAFFDVFNMDDEFVTLQAYRNQVSILNISHEAADKTFKHILSINKGGLNNGKVTRKDIINAHFGYWHTLDRSKDKIYPDHKKFVQKK